MAHGIVFDISEFAIHDGPGLRTTVFLKGCPLRCAWCHNPEGLSAEPQELSTALGERVAGTVYEATHLAALLADQAPLLTAGGGGITLSGGEPLAQAEFVLALLDALPDLHVVLDTSGYAPRAVFDAVVARCHLVYFDLKLIDADQHRRYTGLHNAPILANLAALPALGVPFVVRVPLVPTVTDTAANLAAIADAVARLEGLQRVDLLPYHRAAGGKYRACGREWLPTWPEDQPVNADVTPFARLGIAARVAGETNDGTQ